MRHPTILAALAAATLAATPAFADRGLPPEDDSNSYWLDYKTDISEAKRELRSDLKDARTERDRREAWAEYRREVADARKDYSKQMLDKGYRLGTVTVEDAGD